MEAILTPGILDLVAVTVSPGAFSAHPKISKPQHKFATVAGAKTVTSITNLFKSFDKLKVGARFHFAFAIFFLGRSNFYFDRTNLFLPISVLSLL